MNKFIRYIFANTRGRKSVLIPTLLTLAAGLLITYVATTNLIKEAETDIDKTLSDAAFIVENALVRRSDAYQLILTAGGNFSMTRQEISRQEWQDLVDGLNDSKSFPGLMGIGHSLYLNKSQISLHEFQMRSRGVQDYYVRPIGARNIYTPIVLLSSRNEPKSKDIGYDMFVEKPKRQAMKSARDEGRLVVTRSLVNAPTEAEANLFIFSPIYTSSPRNISERRQSIAGYTFATVNSGDMMEGLFKGLFTSRELAIEVVDSSRQNSQPLYSTANYDYALNHNYVNKTETVAFMDKNWNVNLTLPSEDLYMPAARMLITGLIMSVLISMLIYILLLRKLQFANFQHEKAVEKSKNELIALASHQLRTPATGVKQYVGMIIQGYAGEITDEQRLLLNKAYDSNESQLEIIDALLYVAKAETNQLHLEPKKINITVLINEVIDDLRLQASKKNIRAIFRNTKPVYAEIDPRYMKMALSNIVNNAIKYSHRDSSFRVSLKESSDEILISVKDKGVGIEPNKMQQLFNKFTRLPNKYSQLEGGSGLGLFLSKQIVMAHGGEIDVYSRPEQETVFIIHIPKNSGINNSDTANRIFDKRRVDLSNG